MKIITLLQNEGEFTWRKLLLLATLSGLANAGLLYVINEAAGSVSLGDVNQLYLVMFLGMMTLYVLTTKLSFDHTSTMIEGAIHRVRTRLIERIRSTDLQTLERLGTASIYNTLTQEIAVISQGEGLLTASLQAVLMAIFVSLYIATLSVPAFILLALTVSAGGWLYLRQQRKTLGILRRTIQLQVRFFAMIHHLLAGFKQLKIHRARSDEFKQDIDSSSEMLKELTLDVYDSYNRSFIFSKCFFYALIALIVFGLPQIVPTFSENVVKLTASILFVIGPLSTVMTSLPTLQKCNLAAENIAALERRLATTPGTPGAPSAEATTPFSSEPANIRFEEVRYQYYDREKHALFGVGPINLTIRAGEILLITGGNGSGKSTLLKLLTGLYRPESGRIWYGDRLVTDETRPWYRELFSVIFSDYHLFRKLYGLAEVSGERVEQLLQDLHLSEKTGYKDRGFTRTDLSTGQQKRLAMVVALLEDRPVYVFDEWAAEQDHASRESFYRRMLADLKGSNRTIIAVTHDDRYFEVADRRVKLEEGRIVEVVEAPQAPEPEPQG